MGLEQLTVPGSRQETVRPYGDTVSGTALNEVLEKDYVKEMVTSKTHDESNTAMLRTNDTPNGGHPTIYVIQNLCTSHNQF